MVFVFFLLTVSLNHHQRPTEPRTFFAELASGVRPTRQGGPPALLRPRRTAVGGEPNGFGSDADGARRSRRAARVPAHNMTRERAARAYGTG